MKRWHGVLISFLGVALVMLNVHVLSDYISGNFVLLIQLLSVLLIFVGFFVVNGIGRLGKSVNQDALDKEKKRLESFKSKQPWE